MSDFSDATENALLSHLFRDIAFGPFATVYVALHTGTLAEGDSGNTNEVSGGAYARYTAPAAQWAAPVAGTIENNQDFTFPQATADWGTIGTVSVNTAASGAGTVIVYGNLDTAKVVGSSDTFALGSANLDISLS